MRPEAGPIRPAPDGTGVWIDLKVVPGASRTELAGLHGDRYRLRVAAPPEGGKANDKVVAFLARLLGVARRDVAIVKGHGSPRKTVAVRSVDPTEVQTRLR